jgi:glutathione S-transferase
MGSKLILYDYLFSGNAYKVRLLLTQLGLAFDDRPLDILAGETQRPWFLEKNPMGQVPVLELPDGVCLRESSAILMHLAEGTALYPADALLRTRVHEWLAFEQSNVDQVIARARFRRVFPDAIPTRAEEHAAWQSHGHRALAAMNHHLRTRAFFVGGRYTIADIALYAYTHCAGEGGFELGRYPAIELWCERVRGVDDHLPMDRVPGS